MLEIESYGARQREDYETEGGKFKSIRGDIPQPRAGGDSRCRYGDLLEDCVCALYGDSVADGGDPGSPTGNDVVDGISFLGERDGYGVAVLDRVDPERDSGTVYGRGGVAFYWHVDSLCAAGEQHREDYE